MSRHRDTQILIISKPSYRTQLMQSYLEQAGIEVLVADDDPGTLQPVLGQDPDLVLLELAQSDLDGLSMCRHVRSRSSVPLIVVGPQHVADTVAVLQEGADGYIPRPVSNRELLAHVRAVMRRVRRRADIVI